MLETTQTMDPPSAEHQILSSRPTDPCSKSVRHRAGIFTWRHLSQELPLPPARQTVPTLFGSHSFLQWWKRGPNSVSSRMQTPNVESRRCQTSCIAGHIGIHFPVAGDALRAWTAHLPAMRPNISLCFFLRRVPSRRAILIGTFLTNRMAEFLIIRP